MLGASINTVSKLLLDVGVACSAIWTWVALCADTRLTGTALDFYFGGQHTGS
jgi:hypothetical protein